MIFVITVVNVVGTRQRAKLLNVTTTIKVAAILVVSTVLLWHGKHSVLGDISSSAHQSSGFVGFGVAMISVLWAYERWQYVTYTAGETGNPQRTFHLAFFIDSAALTASF